MEPLFLLFGLMLTTIYLEKMERGGLFDKLRESMDDPVNWKRSAKIMLVSAVGSAAVMNDSVALIFSGVVVDLCARHKVVDSFPYLLSLATAANIGSALTMTGNPQNILIVTLSYDDIGWIEFVRNMILPVLTASVVNGMFLFTYYTTELFPSARRRLLRVPDPPLGTGGWRRRHHAWLVDLVQDPTLHHHHVFVLFRTWIQSLRCIHSGRFDFDGDFRVQAQILRSLAGRRRCSRGR
jgi:Na+/H+ antiporter NhaD/arsenite permease-like protein